MERSVIRERCARSNAVPDYAALIRATFLHFGQPPSFPRRGAPGGCQIPLAKMRGVAERREALDIPRRADERATARLREARRAQRARSPLGAPPRLSADARVGLPPQLRAGLPGTRGCVCPSPSPASTLRSGRNAARRDARSRPSAQPTKPDPQAPRLAPSQSVTGETPRRARREEYNQMNIILSSAMMILALSWAGLGRGVIKMRDQHVRYRRNRTIDGSAGTSAKGQQRT
jgi:hypothetical protein